jgi:tRNA 2-thiouridine synthesizing protein E
MTSSINKVERDIEGYIIDPESWNPDIACELASEENLDLTEDYWTVFRFMRDYWNEHRIAPDVRHVISHMAELKHCGKKQAKQQVFRLFPYGYVKQACKLAGMQRPRAWSTG